MRYRALLLFIFVSIVSFAQTMQFTSGGTFSKIEGGYTFTTSKTDEGAYCVVTNGFEGTTPCPFMAKLSYDAGEENVVMLSLYCADASFISNVRQLISDNGGTSSFKGAYLPVTVTFNSGSSAKEKMVVFDDNEVFKILITKAEKAWKSIDKDNITGVTFGGKTFKFSYFESAKTVAAMKNDALKKKGRPQMNVTAPYGTEIYVDNTKVGTGSMVVNLDYGKHTIEARKEGFYTLTNTIEITYPTGNTLVVPSLAKRSVIRVTAEDKDARISIDGKVVGTGTANWYVADGKHTVSASKDKHYTQSAEYDVSGGFELNLHVDKLEPITGKVVIESNTPANVEIVGVKSGTTPFVIDNLLIGEYTVKLTKDNHFPVEQKIEVGEKQTTSLNATLEPFAVLQVDSKPTSSSVYIDGHWIAWTSTLINLGYGTHEIKVSRSYYKPKTKTITINDMSTKHLNFRLHRQCQQYWHTYFQPTYQHLPYKAAGLEMGFVGNHFNMEGHFLYGLEHPDDVYWVSEYNPEHSASYLYTYTPMSYGGKFGASWVAGTRFRFTPQVGVNVNSFLGRGDRKNTMSSSIGLVGGLKIEFALNRWLGIAVSPEYNYSVFKTDNFKALSKASPSFTNMTDGLQVRAGVVMFIGHEK